VLGQDVEVTVKPAARRKAGDMSVVVLTARSAPIKMIEGKSSAISLKF